jgi:short-subunit dehydrogenase
MTNTVIITGASQGIGKATALKFARQGYDVVLAARQLDRLEAAANEVRSLGREALAISTDVKQPEQVNNLIQESLLRFGQIDVLINNSGIFFLGSVEATSLEDWHQVIDTNLWGYIHTINALLPHFLERGSGTIVNVGSIGGLNAIPYLVPYTTSKFAVTGLTKSLQAELSPKGVQVCGVYPSFIGTNFMERAIFRGNDEKTTQARYQLADKARHIPGLEKPEDVSEAIWKAVKYRHKNQIVGTAKVWTTVYQLFPGLAEPLVRLVFGMSERH